LKQAWVGEKKNTAPSRAGGESGKSKKTIGWGKLTRRELGVKNRKLLGYRLRERDTEKAVSPKNKEVDSGKPTVSLEKDIEK